MTSQTLPSMRLAGLHAPAAQAPAIRPSQDIDRPAPPTPEIRPDPVRGVLAHNGPEFPAGFFRAENLAALTPGQGTRAGGAAARNSGAADPGARGAANPVRLTVDDIAEPHLRQGYTFRVLCFFAALGPGVTVDLAALTDLLYRGDADGGPDHLFAAGCITLYARRWLRPGWAIVNLHGRGYMLERACATADVRARNCGSCRCWAQLGISEFGLCGNTWSEKYERETHAGEGCPDYEAPAC